MLAYRCLVACCLAAVALACSEPTCPAGYMKYGNQCRRCKPGEERERGQCVPILDGGVEPPEGEDPEEAREDAATEPDSEEGSDDTTENLEDASVISLDAANDTPCYRDEDGDGVGAGDPVDCGQNGSSPVSTTNTDCDDTDPNRSPSLSDVCGDQIDNDCDGAADNESNNACGGPCSTQLGHQPGEPCDNGLKGACLRTGKYECSGSTGTRCNAPLATASGELCADDIDNDCDGAIDEDDAVDARAWFQDCDNDGYPAALSSVACEKPAPTTSCANWLSAKPTSTTEDCWDYSSSYRPGLTASALPQPGNPSGDLNCDGTVDYDESVTWPLPGSLVFNVAYLCSPNLDCGTCWTEACSGREGSGGCFAAQPLEPVRCTSSLRVRTAPNSGCMWSGPGVMDVSAQLECL